MAEEGETHTFSKNLKWLINYDFDENNFVQTKFDIGIISNGESIQMTDELLGKFGIDIELLSGEVQRKEVSYSGTTTNIEIESSGQISLLVISFDGVELVRISGHE